MSNASSTGSSGGAGRGRLLLWVVLALTLVLLSLVTATAIRNNPIYSDREAYGISKYRFIEECRERLHTPGTLPLMTGMGQVTPLDEAVKGTGAKQASQDLQVETAAEPQDIDSGLVADPQQGLQLALPVMIQLRDRNTGVVTPLAPANLRCAYDKTKQGEERLDVMLVPGS